MANKLYRESLTGKMVRRLLNGLGVGLFLIVLIYFGCANILQQYFFSSGYLYNAEAGRIEEFQKYVKENGLSSDDSGELRKWVKERNIKEFTVSKGKWLIFDSSYEGEILPESIELNKQSWKFYYPVAFFDGSADVYINEGITDKYYNVLLGASIVIGFLACLAVFVSGMKEDVTYIQCLEREVGVISQGNLQEEVTIKGADELAQLAAGLDQMRQKLKEKEQTEQELRSAQEKLVLGMSHDLRTPLTGLMTYMEILKKQEQEGTVSREYIEKAYDKILQIKNLSDQMFEFFLIDSHKEMELEPPEVISSALGDYLSEMCALLECDGFCVSMGKMVWKPVLVRVNTDYMGRILNNIISNLEKYGDREREVQIELLYYSPGKVGVSVRNTIAEPGQYVEGTGIGVKNISMMMEKMGGSAEVHMMDTVYQIVLYFPICGGEDGF